MEETSASFAARALAWDNINERVLRQWFDAQDGNISQTMAVVSSLAHVSSSLAANSAEPDYATVSPADIYEPLPMGVVDLELAIVLNAEVATKMVAIGSLRAAATALNRYSTAVAAGSTRNATYQFTAFWAYAKEAATSLRRNSSDLNDLLQMFQVKGVPGFNISAEDITATQERLRATGFSAEETASLTRTGASPEDIERARQILLAVEPSQAAGDLYTLLEQEVDGASDVARSLETLLGRDPSPPSSFDLLLPDDEAATHNRPIFSWTPSLDTGRGSTDSVSGLVKYELWIDGALARDNIPAFQLSATPQYALSEGAHTWHVRAVDAAGNLRRSSAVRTIVAATLPNPLVVPVAKTFFPTGDANIHNDVPYSPPTDWSNFNFGSNPNLSLSRDGQTTTPRILLNFDVSPVPPNSVITSAKLRLYCHYAGNWESVGLYRLTQQWTEGTGGSTGMKPADGVTWNTRDGIQPWAAPGGAPDITERYRDLWFDKDDIGWKSWDVTDLVASWLSGEQSGLMLASLASGSYYGLKFYSREYGDSSLWPRLELEYTPASQPVADIIDEVRAEPQQFDAYAKDTGHTTIYYRLKNQALVTMEIRDSRGEIVKEKLPRVGAAPGEVGENAVVWNGIIDFPELNKGTPNASDRSVFIAPNGMYTIRIIAVDPNDVSRLETEEIEIKVKSAP